MTSKLKYAGPAVACVWGAVLFAWTAAPAQAQFDSCEDTLALVSPSSLDITFVDAPLLAELASENDVADDASEPIEPAIEVELASQANRDPFVISGARFPREVVPSDIATDQGKSDLDRSEDPMQAQARLIAQLGVLVDRLALEAVMMGRPPYAVIDGQTWTIGDLVPAGDVRSVMFELTDIRERVVTLETEGLRFELRIPAPSGG